VPFPSIGIVIVGHGSRLAQANADFEELVARFAAAHSEFDVSFGYIELASPSLAEALAASLSFVQAFSATFRDFNAVNLQLKSGNTLKTKDRHSEI
jgi:hypothetical protein